MPANPRPGASLPGAALDAQERLALRPQGVPNLHDGTITTDRPNTMWGTDGIRIETADEGWVWVFSAEDHCDA